MFKLIKLAAYALLGYALYEFFRGMNDSEGGRRRQPAPQQGETGRNRVRAPNQDAPRNPPITGPGRGTTTTTQESGGGSASHVVGRGAVNR